MADFRFRPFQMTHQKLKRLRRVGFGPFSPSSSSSFYGVLLMMLAVALIAFAFTINLMHSGLAAHTETTSGSIEDHVGGNANAISKSAGSKVRRIGGAGAGSGQLKIQIPKPEKETAANANANAILGATASSSQTTDAAAFAGQKLMTVQNQNENGISSNGDANGRAISTADLSLPAHLTPPIPYLPPHASVPNADDHIEATLSGREPTVAGIHAILQRFLSALHESNLRLESEAKANDALPGLRERIISAYFNLVGEHLRPLSEAYRGRNVFPVKEDESIFLSLASFRDVMLDPTLREAFGRAERPDKLFVGAVVQNCFGDSYTCKTGAKPTGELNKNGKKVTRIVDAPPDRNGIEEFCTDPAYRKYCEAGQVRVLYVNETESLGPAVARYYASTLWGGETYFFQSDAHVRFSQNFDTGYIAEVMAAKNYPKAILSSYPAGFKDDDPYFFTGTQGSRLCTYKFGDFKLLIVTTGSKCSNDDIDGPTQIPFMAAGSFFARAEFLKDVPFDPYLPWMFMGEEIALSIRAWTSGWNMYAPRKHLMAHQYRNGPSGYPKFWGTVGRLFGREGKEGLGMAFNTALQRKVAKRIKNMVGYPDCTTEQVEKDGDELVLTELDHYTVGTERSRESYLELIGVDLKNHTNRRVNWCNQCELA